MLPENMFKNPKTKLDPSLVYRQVLHILSNSLSSAMSAYIFTMDGPIGGNKHEHFLQNNSVSPGSFCWIF